MTHNFLMPANELPPKKKKDSNPYPSRHPSQSLLLHGSTAVYLGLHFVKAFYAEST